VLGRVTHGGPAGKRRPIGWIPRRSAWVTVALVSLLATLLATLPDVVAHADEELDYGLKREKLARIELSGNATFSADAIKDVLTIQEPDWRHPLAVPQYRPDLIEGQLAIIAGFYRHRGFHQVAVQLDSIRALPERGDILHISVVEGPRTWIEEVVLIGNPPLAEKEVRERLQLRKDDPAPADLSDLGPEIYSVRTLYWDQGFLDVSIEPTMDIVPTEDTERFAATLKYRIEPGVQYRIGDVTIRGNVQTKTSLIARELRVASGDLFAWSAVEESRRRVLQTSLFRDVSFLPTNLDSVSGTGDLIVRVVERKPAFYELGAGIGSRERIRVLGIWGHNNLWGTGRRLTLWAKGYYTVEEIVGKRRDFDDGDINYRFTARYGDSHLFGSDFALTVDSYAERRTRGESGLILNTIAVTVGTQRRFGLRWDHILAAQIKVNRPEVHPLAGEDLEERFERANVTDTQTRSLIYSILHDNRDDPFRPQGGIMTSTQAQLAGGLLGGDNSFVKWWGAIHQYSRFVLGGILATRLRLGLAIPYAESAQKGPEGVPFDDRYFAGGASTVRGYRENSLGPQIQDQEELDELEFGSDVPLVGSPARGGNYQLITNIEWRFPIPFLSRWNFASVAFFDGGNVWATISDIRLKSFRLHSIPGAPNDPESTKLWDYRYSVGTGLRLDTPFGPFRIDVGFPLKRARYVSVDETFTDPAVIYHFSLGYPF